VTLAVIVAHNEVNNTFMLDHWAQSAILMRNKTVLVTGSTDSIGKETAR